MQPSRSELKIGKRPHQQQIRNFKAGEALFTEGTTGRELFVIRKGSVGIYRDGPDGRVELAFVSEGGIVGEMSLLDALPRSATVIAREDVSCIVIGYEQYQTVIKTIPVWLRSLIKIVVSRLRDANRRVDQAVARNRQRSFVALIKLLLPSLGRKIDSVPAIPLDTLLAEAWYVCHLKKKESEELIDYIVKRSIIRTVVAGEERFIGIQDREVLDLFEEYLTLKDRKTTFRELSIPEQSYAVLGNIAYVAQKAGHETEDGTSLMKQALVDDMDGRENDSLDKALLDLRRRGCIIMLPGQNDTEIIFKKETIRRIKKIREWVPRFSQELQ